MFRRAVSSLVLSHRDDDEPPRIVGDGKILLFDPSKNRREKEFSIVDDIMLQNYALWRLGEYQWHGQAMKSRMMMIQPSEKSSLTLIRGLASFYLFVHMVYIRECPEGHVAGPAGSHQKLPILVNKATTNLLIRYRTKVTILNTKRLFYG